MVTPIISVVVPAFKRPEMLEDLIRSFELQTLDASELIIVDDCPEDEMVRQTVLRYGQQDPRIRFYKNDVNLGFCKNLLRSIELARGLYIVVMGDDDIFMSFSALAEYRQVFDENPDVAYAYSNLVQFNGDYELDYAFKYFASSRKFSPGIASLRATWLRSCYIPGIALRNNADLVRYYPEKDMLFPQVELVGKLLAENSSFGIARYLVAGRAHDSQLGFAAASGNLIKGDEKQSVDELGQIVRKLQTFYRDETTVDLPTSVNDVVHTFYRQAHATILPTEKVHCGNRQILETLIKAIRNDVGTLLDFRFLAYFMISLLLPKEVLLRIKELRKKAIIRKMFTKESAMFSAFILKVRPDLSSSI